MVSDHLTSDVKKAFSSAGWNFLFSPCAHNPSKGGVQKSQSIRRLSNTQTYSPSGANKVTQTHFLYPILMLALMQANYSNVAAPRLIICLNKLLNSLHK